MWVSVLNASVWFKRLQTRCFTWCYALGRVAPGLLRVVDEIYRSSWCVTALWIPKAQNARSYYTLSWYQTQMRSQTAYQNSNVAKVTTKAKIHPHWYLQKFILCFPCLVYHTITVVVYRALFAHLLSLSKDNVNRHHQVNWWCVSIPWQWSHFQIGYLQDFRLFEDVICCVYQRPTG